MIKSQNSPAKILGEAARQHRPTHEPTGEDFRILKATLLGIEFDCVQWAAKRAGAGHTSQPLAEFMRDALRQRVREVVQGEIARGRSVPADIAHAISSPAKMSGGKL